MSENNNSVAIGAFILGAALIAISAVLFISGSGWGGDKSRVWMMSSYRGNAGRSNGATTWYLAEDIDQSPLGWRGPLHYVPVKGTEGKI